MLSFKSKQSKRSVEVDLLPSPDRVTNGTSPLWLSSENICGRAVFRLPDNVEFSHSKVKLKGIVTTRTSDGPDSISKSVRLEKLPFLGITLDSKAHSGYKSRDGVVQVPFRFNLDSIHSRAKSSFFTDLPPSLNSREDRIRWSELRKGDSEALYDVTYSIAASVYSKKGLEASTEKTIQVLPVSQEIGPRSQADCPGEYIPAQSVPRSRRVSHSKAQPFKLEVAGQSPEAVSLSAQDMFFSGTTRIPFVVKASPSSSTRFDTKSLPTQCRVSARLLSKTLITPNRIEQHWIPIIEQGRHTQNTSLKVDKGKEQEFSIKLLPWKHVAPSTGDEFAVSSFSLDFRVSTDQARIPTFFTPLLSRRYAIDIQIEYPETPSASSRLSLPLHISYDVNEPDVTKLASTKVLHTEVEVTEESESD